MGNDPQLAVAGCGDVSGQYFQALAAAGIPITAVVDSDLERARTAQRRCDALSAHASLSEAHHHHRLTHVVVLVPPAAQRDVVMEALSFGADVYCEKPGGVDAAQLAEMRSLAEASEARLAFGPDTQLSPVWGAARRLIVDGAIGAVYRISTQYLCGGHELWHPRPEHFYDAGGGPLRDLGPYAIAALVALVGVPLRVACVTQVDRGRVRLARHSRIDVQVPTHAFITFHYDNALGTAEVGYRGPSGGENSTYVRGTAGVLRLPPPEHHAGSVFLSRSDRVSWEELPVSSGNAFVGRGQGAVAFLKTDHELVALSHATLALVGLCEQAATLGASIAVL